MGIPKAQWLTRSSLPAFHSVGHVTPRILMLSRAGDPNYVINAAALAYLIEHGVPESIVAALLAAGPRSFADEPAWQAHLDSFGLGAGQRRRVIEAAMVG